MKNSVFVVLLSPGDRGPNIFLVKRHDQPYWDLTGGGIEQGESPARAGKREVHEETGFDVVGLSECFAEYKMFIHQGGSHYLTYLFAGFVQPQTYEPERPGNEGRWFPYLDLPLVRPINVVRIQDAVAFYANGQRVKRTFWHQ